MFNIKEYLKNITLNFSMLGIDVEHMVESFVLNHAKKQKRGIKLPSGIVKGELKNCFKNATVLALSSPNFKYFEGYAVSITGIPVLHAWVEDKNKNIIDNTWKDPHKCFYLGVYFNDTILRKELIKNEVYGLLNFGYCTNIDLIKSFKAKKVI
jgi:hypothetical protein